MVNKFLFILFLLYLTSSKILEINPNVIIKDLEINIGQELFYKVFINKLSPSSSYKIIVHYLGPIGVEFQINIICNRITRINTNNKDDIQLKDNDSYDFLTDKYSIPSVCTEKIDHFYISIMPVVISNQFFDLKSIHFQLEILENRYRLNDRIVIAFFGIKGLEKVIFPFIILFTILAIYLKSYIKMLLLKFYGVKKN